MRHLLHIPRQRELRWPAEGSFIKLPIRRPLKYLVPSLPYPPYALPLGWEQQGRRPHLFTFIPPCCVARRTTLSSRSRRGNSGLRWDSDGLVKRAEPRLIDSDASVDHT
jgi:hypothetical protein